MPNLLKLQQRTGVVLALLSCLLLNRITQIKTNSDQNSARDNVKWPNKQLNVLVDVRSLNISEQQMVETILDQIERRTCVRVNRLQADKVNPFDSRQLGDKEKNFIYLFKSHQGLYNKPPPVGLSTLGCAQRGRQSVVLTDAAFRWPQLILRYHLLRSLGLSELQKPSEQELAQLDARQLPLSQKIAATKNGSLPQLSGNVDASPPMPTYITYATGPVNVDEEHPPIVRSQPLYLSDDDLAAIKQLYDCQDYQNRLSVKPPVVAEPPLPRPVGPINLTENRSTLAGTDEQTPAPTTDDGSLTAKKLKRAEESLRQIIQGVALEKGAQIDEDLVENAAKSIVHYLLAELEGDSMNPAQNPGIKQDGQQLDSLLNNLDKSMSENQTEMTEQEEGAKNHAQERRSTSEQQQSEQGGEQERPMLLKLDPYHANDPQLRQANQMKLSQLANGSSSNSNWASQLPMPQQTYRLLNQTPTGQALPFDFNSASGSPSQPQPQPPMRDSANGKSEMMISFEQTPDRRNPMDALASSQVLKLCSCTCQTMTPSSSGTLPPPSTSLPPPLPSSTEMPTIPNWTSQPTWTTVTDYPSIPTGNTPTWPSIDPPLTDDPNWLPWPTNPSSTKQPTKAPPVSPTNGGGQETWPSGTGETFTYAPQTMPTLKPPLPSPTTTQQSTATTASENNNTSDDIGGGGSSEPTKPTPSNATTEPADWSVACDQVQWVKPNKTIYSSAKIVWDVDRANQNYFLCQAQLDSGELVPGKTHGLSCKVSSEGKAYEMHQFQVLIKPEQVNLAWVQKSSKSFGSKNLPVIGGYSRPPPPNANNLIARGDPYLVSRCLVRDENNDVITLIGYINRQNVGWFPFDDIQIECSQYDVLACVN